MKHLVSKIALIAALLSLFAFAAPVFAAVDCSASNLSTSEATQCGIDGASGNNQDPSQATSNISSTVATIINLLSIAAGTAAVIMLMIGGFRYVTSAGNPETAKSARNTILYATVGLVIVALAQVIVHFVLHQANNVTK